MNANKSTQFFDRQSGFTPNQPNQTAQSEIAFHSEQVYVIETQISELQEKLNYHKSVLTTLSKPSTNYAEKVGLPETIGSIDKYGLYVWLCANVDMVESFKTGRMDRPDLLPEGKQETKGFVVRTVHYPDTLQINLINIFRLIDVENVSCDLLAQFEEFNHVSQISYSVLIKDDNNKPLIAIKLKGRVSLEEFDRDAEKMRSICLNKNDTVKSDLIKTLVFTQSQVNYVRILPYTNKLTDLKSIDKVQEMIDLESRVGRASMLNSPETVYIVYRIKESATGADAIDPFEALAMVNIKE